jgi:glutaredoxin-related protein
MPRPILDESHIHPAIRERVAGHEQGIVLEVQAALVKHQVVVVGMGMNPFPKKARRALDAAGVAYHYLEYGNYLNTWRRRNALKLWTGWPTFPMVFVKGTLVGGASELAKLINSGDVTPSLTDDLRPGEPTPAKDGLLSDTLAGRARA